MIKQFYAPWWIHTKDPLSVSEEPYNIYMDDDLLSDEDIGLKIQKHTPELWDLAGNYAVGQAKLDENGKWTYPEWNEEAKEFYESTSNRARYLLNNYKDFEPLREKSQVDNLNISFGEKWGYGVDESFEQAGKVGIPSMLATGTEIASSALRSLDDLSKNLDLAFEKTFGERDEAAGHRGMLFPFSSQDEKDFWKEQYQEKRDRIKKEKEKKEPDELTFKFLDEINEWAENTAIKNLKSFEKRHAKDLRYQAYQQYLQNKPVGWFTTFESPEYFTDTMISMVPSMVVMGATMGAGMIAGAPAAIGIGMVGHAPLEASGTYTEAYRWTMDNFQDEELARSNAAWSTAGYLTIVAGTEGLGASKLIKALMPKKIQNSIKNKAFRTLYKGNVSDEGKKTVLGEMGRKWREGKLVDKSTYHALTSPFSEALQEYVQYGGQILTEAGYKDESMNIIDIAMMNHPLVDPTELHESVVGGGLFGSISGASGYLGKKLFFNEDTNMANNILANEYGVDTGVPNVDLSEESLYNVPIVKGDSKPTWENYLKELANPKPGEDATIVSREKSKNTPLGELIKKQKNYDNTAIAEKMAETIKDMGKNEWDKVSQDTKNKINSHLLGAVLGLQGKGGEDIVSSKILRNNDNIAKDILDGKISFERIGKGQKTQRGFNVKRGTRTLKIHDKQYADSVVKMYESEISENFEGKDINENSTARYLENTFGITIDKSLKQELKSSIQQNIEGQVVSQAQREVEQQAEKQIIEQMEKETTEAVKKKVGIKEYKTEQKESPKIIGQEAVLTTGDYANQKGVITAYDDKKELVNIKLPDGTRVGPVKSSDVQLFMSAPPTKPTVSKKPVGIIGKEGKTKVETKDSISKDLDVLSKKQDKLFGEADDTIALKVEEKLYEKYDLWDDDGNLPTGNELIKIEKTGLDYKKDWTGEKFSITEKAKEILNSSELKELQLNVDEVNNIEEQASKIIKKLKVSKKTTTKKKPTDKDKLKQQVNQAIDINREIRQLSTVAGLQKALGEDTKKDDKKIRTNKELLRSLLSKDDVRQELSKQGKLKAIEKILGEDTDTKKKLHRIGDAYEKGERKATKAFISKAVREIMGKHSPDINKIFVEEIKEDPAAVGAYSNGMVEFVLGRATQHTAYHEPIHWFMNRVLDDNDYNTVINHFKGEEPATRAAADWYMGQKDRNLTEKIKDIFRKFWIAIQKFLNMQVTKEDTIFDIFDRIGRDFTIRNFRDRMNEYDIGADVDFDGLQPIYALPSITTTTFEQQIEKYIHIPLSEYRPREQTIGRAEFILENPYVAGKYSGISMSQIPASSSSEIIMPYSYGFSEVLSNQGDKISISSPFSTKNLSKYEKSVVENFYKNIKDAEWTEGKKSVDRELLIQKYESYIEQEFPLNAYAVRYKPENINQNGNAVPMLLPSLLPSAEKNNISDDFFSSRIMLTDNEFYKGFGHRFQLEQNYIDEDKSIEKFPSSPQVNGLGWYVYVEPKMKRLKQLNDIAIIYEIQQDINDVIEKFDDKGKEVQTKLDSEIDRKIAEGIITPEEGARLYLKNKAYFLAKDRMLQHASHTGDKVLVKEFITMYNKDHEFKLIHPNRMPDVYDKLIRETKKLINRTSDIINEGIQKSIVNRMMTKVMYDEMTHWNNFRKSLGKDPYQYIDKYYNFINKRLNTILTGHPDKTLKNKLVNDLQSTLGDNVIVHGEGGAYSSRNLIPVDKNGELDESRLQSISSLLNKIGLDKESKKYISLTLKNQKSKFPTILKTVARTADMKELGVEIKFRIALYDFFKRTSADYSDLIKKSEGSSQLERSFNTYWAQKNAYNKHIKRNQEKRNQKNIKLNQRLKWKLSDWFTSVSKVSKIAQRYVDLYNRQVDGITKSLQDRVDLWVDDYDKLKSGDTASLQKTDKLVNEAKRFKEISIHHSILTAHQRGNKYWGITGADANTKLEGNPRASRLYVNDYELNDPDRAKSYEEWKLRSNILTDKDVEIDTEREAQLREIGAGNIVGLLGQEIAREMGVEKEFAKRKKLKVLPWVDKEFGLQKGNHLKSDEQLESELLAIRQDKILKRYQRISVLDKDNKTFTLRNIKYNTSREISLPEAIQLYKDAPQLGAVWTAARKVLRKLGLNPEFKKYSALEAPIVRVRIPDNFNAVPIKRFHKIEEVPEFQKSENSSEEIQRKTGVKDESTPIKDTIVEDAVNLNRAVQNFNKPEKIKELFSSSFNKIKNKYGIEVADYVPILSKSINKSIAIREDRDMVKNLLSEWAVSVDPDVGIKMRSDNKAMKLIDLIGKTGAKKRRIRRQLADLDVVENIERTLEGHSPEDSHDVTREGLHISNTTDIEEIENNNDIDTYNFSDDRFFKFLEETNVRGYLSPKETAELMSEVVVKDFAGFTSYLSSKYNWEPVTTADNNTVRGFWVRNQMINRQSGYDKPSWWYANVTYDGKVLSNKDDKRLVPKVGGHPKYGKDLRSNKDLPRTVGVSFLDYDNMSYEWSSGGDIKYSRMYLKDMIDVHKGEEKGGYFSTLSYVTLNGQLIRDLDRNFAKYADEEIGDKRARTIVAVKASGNQPSFIVARASEDIMEISSNIDSVVDYLDYEVSIGNMNESNKKELLKSMQHEIKKSPLNNYVIAQHILTHETMKRARGRDYLIRTPNTSHHSRRLGIDDGNGIVAVGAGDFTIKIIDQSKAFISKGVPGATGSSAKIPMADYIAGLPDKYHGDGSLWVDSDYLDKTSYNIGRIPTTGNSSKLREIKTRIRFISKNDDFSKKHYGEDLQPGQELEGTNYLAMKHNEFVPEENIYITDEADNIIAYTVNVDGSIHIYDADDNRMTMFGTLDEAKEPDGGSGAFKLNGRISTNILTLPEESRRIVKVPKQQGHNSAAFPWMWMSHLYDSSFDGLRDSLLTRMLNVAKGNMRALFAARQDPQVMRALMGQFKSDGLTIMNEVDRLIEPSEGLMIQDGFMYPHIIRGILSPIKNRVVKENSYGGRRRGFGSFPVIKSDLSKTIVSKKDGVVLSGDDVTMVRFLKDFLNVEGFGNELIDNINEALRTRKEYLMVGRWPAYTLSSVYLARIEKVMPRGHGDVVWFHPETALGKLQADHDGDTSFLIAPYFGMNYMDRSVINKFNNKEVKDSFSNMESFVRLEYFKKSNINYKMTSKRDMYITVGKLGRGMNSQGMLMNAVTFMEDMYSKDLKMEIGGQKIVVRNPNEENIIMSYAKLNDDVTQEMLDLAKMGQLVNKDGSQWTEGDKYLKTSPLKQLHILLQAAVDNSKEFLLADWGFGGWVWIAPRMFIQDNGSPIGSKQAHTISSIVRKQLMNNVSRRGVDMDTNRTQDIDGMFHTSKKMYELNQMSGIERGMEIKDRANTRRIKYGKDSKLAKRTYAIDKITFNNKLLPLERLIAVPHESLIEYQENNPDDKVHNNPLGYHPNRIQRGIMYTQQDMYTLQKETERWYPETEQFEKDKEVARRFTNEMGREFYRIAMKHRMYNDSTKSRITSSGYPYQDEIVKFIDKWLNKTDKKYFKKVGLPSWKELSEEQQAYSSLRFLRGILTYSPKTHEKVGEQEKRLFNRLVDLKSKLNEEIDLGIVERIESNIAKVEKQLDNIYTPATYQNMSRPRDIETVLPMPLMHPDVWRTYANLFGPNLRRASSEKISLKADTRYEDRQRRTVESILKECG